VTQVQPGSSTLVDFSGSGTPEGVITAGVGATYRRNDGGTGTTFYIKETGTGNTGWVAVAAAAGSVATDVIWDAKGDLAGGTGANTAARLAVGSNGFVLVADSGEATGMKWVIRSPGWRISGSLYESVPRWAVITAALAITNQRVNLVAIDLPEGITVTSVSWRSGSTAFTAGSGTNHQYMGLYDSSRNRLGVSADDGGAAWAANTTKTLALTSPFVTTYTGLYYLAVLVDHSGDGATPTLVGAGSGANGIPGEAPVTSGGSSTGQTSLPDPAAAISNINSTYWAYVS
jgi:hypothetical protein